MVPVARSLLVTVLCTGLGLGIACRDAPTQDQACLTCPHAGIDLAVDWTIDAPDFIAPSSIDVPARVVVVTPVPIWRAPESALSHDDVLDRAPKTSPPARA